jgi:excisionase family DNA binding protein
MTKPLTVDKLLYTPVEAAHALGLSRSTIYVLMASGEVPSVHIGSSRRIPADGLRRYVAMLANKTTGDRSPAGAADRAEQEHLWK